VLELACADHLEHLAAATCCGERGGLDDDLVATVGVHRSSFAVDGRSATGRCPADPRDGVLDVGARHVEQVVGEVHQRFAASIAPPRVVSGCRSTTTVPGVTGR